MKSNIYFIAALLAMLLAATGLNGQTITGYSELFTFDTRLWELTLQANPEAGGALTGEGDYLEHKPVTLDALAADGFTFISWTDADGEVISTTPEFEFIMPGEPATLTANFFEHIAPEVITSEITHITTTNATGGGEVTFDGGADVTARGIVWSAAQSPRFCERSQRIDARNHLLRARLRNQ